MSWNPDTLAYGYIPKALLAGCILLSFSACLYEALCPVDSYSPRFIFTYTEDGSDGDGGAAAADPLQKAAIYVFDTNNRYVTFWSLDNPQLNYEYSVPTRLLPGAYHFIAWISQDPPYWITLAPDIQCGCKNGMDLRLRIPSDRIIEEALPPLFYGVSGRIEIRGASEQVIPIPLTRNTNTIILTVTGLERTNDAYVFDIKDNNGNYDFDNDFLPCEDFHYRRMASFPSHSSSALTTSIITLKLAESRNPLLTFSNHTSGTVLFPAHEGQVNSLTKLILLAYEGKSFAFEHKHTFRITINFAVDLTASISVDGWNIDESDYGVIPD
ncbi:MAG: FimB/Mfa2 family fimbrial subunit [Dysgonamonadaceae bacterium]|jgi:hypothetical protein|nr:FimB/Mfa2 family fimbrial subunit [Dysgonamonadaceae bacterium]